MRSKCQVDAGDKVPWNNSIGDQEAHSSQMVDNNLFVRCGIDIAR